MSPGVTDQILGNIVDAHFRDFVVKNFSDLSSDLSNLWGLSIWGLFNLSWLFFGEGSGEKS